MSDYVLDRQAAMLKAVGHPARLRIIDFIAGEPERRERCVCEITPALGLDQSTVSKHLAVLRAHGVLNSRREGSRVLYSLADPAVAAIVRLTREACLARLKETEQVISSLRERGGRR